MATKEDILEQIVEEYLIQKGYFVQHNIKYRPSKDHPNYESRADAVHSDIDVVGIHPLRCDERRVVAVNCKSWQDGFRPQALIKAIDKDGNYFGKPAWKYFRELKVDKWSKSFICRIKDVTGESRFTHITAVTRLIGKKEIWEEHKPFRRAIGDNSLQILTLSEMIEEFRANLTTTLARTEVGRILQLFSAANIEH